VGDGWDVQLALPSGDTRPLFLQIAHQLSDGIRQGRLRPAQRLPGSRQLAQQLGVHRNTVISAYQELIAEGWLTTHLAGGTFVSADIPVIRPRPFGPDPGRPSGTPGFALSPGSTPVPEEPFAPGTLVLKSGMSDLRLLPTDLLGRAYRRAVKVHGHRLLDYGDPRGWPPLREAIATMLAAMRGLVVGADQVLISRGSQQGLDLAARTLLQPGDVVAIEALGYAPAWEAFRRNGAELVSLPVDEGGLDVDALAALLADRPVRAVYLTPHHQYPTTRTLTAARRLRLLSLAERYRVAVIEDDYDYEFHYEGRPIMPLASADRAGVVVYVGTLSKILAPGLRIGFVVAPTAMIDRLAETRQYSDRQGDQMTEAAVTDLITDRDLQRHANAMRRTYRDRRDALAAALERHLGSVLRFATPSGGMALWAEADPTIDMEAWSQRARERGVGFLPGRRYDSNNGDLPATRLGFAPLTEGEIWTAVQGMAAALPPVTLGRP
jgi:GntR family transcriptional regulator/MocR family aminotransferase